MTENLSPTHSTALSLSVDGAPDWNQSLMRRFQAELERNPRADLLSMFPESYREAHRELECLQPSLSDAAKYNLETLHDLHDNLKEDPETNLLSCMPGNYNRKITMFTGPKASDSPEYEVPEQKRDFCDKLDLSDTAQIVFPLSSAVTAQISNSHRVSGNHELELATSIKQLLRGSPKIWECPVRGMVVRWSEQIVGKVIQREIDTTEYTSLQFLAHKVPDLPIPRPHGMVDFGFYTVIFMDYIPGTTLAQAWTTLSHNDKSSIQQQLEDIFCHLRSIQPDGAHINRVGGVGGEGAKAFRVSEVDTFKGIQTSQQFSDLQFSPRHYGSKSYAKFLQAFTQIENPSILELVFTHGDVRTANIMVERNSDSGYYSVTGIIDWEDSGFYPAYYESTALTTCLSARKEDDWYLYLPKSISPSQYPVRWLVDRLWDFHLRYI